MPDDKKPHLPIGYWVRQADEALAARIDEAQNAHGLSRTDWQVLNVLSGTGQHTLETVARSLRPFAGRSAIVGIVGHFAERGLVEGEGTPTGPYRLTADGRRLHETALATQKAVRQQAMEGVSDADYLTTVRTLQRIVENLAR